MHHLASCGIADFLWQVWWPCEARAAATAAAAPDAMAADRAVDLYINYVGEPELTLKMTLKLAKWGPRPCGALVAAFAKSARGKVGELDAAMGKLAERRRVVQLALASEPWSKSRTALVAELGEPSASAVRKLTLDDVTADAARELEAKVDALKTELEAVRALTPGGVWADELRAYLAAFGAQKRARE